MEFIDIFASETLLIFIFETFEAFKSYEAFEEFPFNSIIGKVVFIKL